jgi:hypothetical protein
MIQQISDDEEDEPDSVISQRIMENILRQRNKENTRNI